MRSSLSIDRTLPALTVSAPSRMVPPVSTIATGALSMGAIHVTATIRNPAEREKCWQGRFLVDTGATDSVVPKRHLDSIGLQPEEMRLYELADGTEVEMGVAGVRLELMGTFTMGLAVFGEDDAEPILGVTALESIGVEIDPRNQRLKRLPAVRLK